MSQNTHDLKKAGLKVTLPRLRILQLLEAAEEKRHVTADDVYKMLIDQGEDIGLATVYRVLNQFEAAGLVVKHMFEDGSGRPAQACYELDQGQHEHMVDIDTGEVTEFIDPEIHARLDEIAREHGCEIVEQSLVLYVQKIRS
ncbi:MAG: transcriptional repressor [Pseudomonadota bacterium]